MDDPGTIYSDDNCEDESSDDEGEQNNRTKNAESSEEDNFFDDMCGDTQMYENENFGESQKKKPSGIEKYFDKKNVRDIDSKIKRVLEKEEGRSDLNVKKPKISEAEKQKLDNMKVKPMDAKRFQKKMNKLNKKKVIPKKEDEVEENMDFEMAAQPNSDITFLEMNLSTPLLKAIANVGYQKPTPIQASAIPLALKGRDICACASTGTGKTAAFMLPILQRLIFRPQDSAVTRVLVLVPTRELGIQVYEVSNDLSYFTNIKIALTVGGLNMMTQSEELSQNPDIIIATPGRLIDHIHNTPSFNLQEIEILVLDEADRMLDENFTEQLTEVIRQCCIQRQTMLFSATMTEKVKSLMAMSLKNPVRVFVNANTDVAQNLQQEFVRLSGKNQDDCYRLAVLAYLLVNHFDEQTIVFVHRRELCHRMHVIFGLLGLKCGELHAKLKQHERFNYLEKFKSREIDILFATDVAARGLDIKGIKTVINYSVPDSYEMYVHRVGRTARAGYAGRSVSISRDTGKDYTMLRQIQKNSLTPLFERVISQSNMDLFKRKIQEVEPAVAEVFAIKEEEARLQGATNALNNLQEKMSGNKLKKMSKSLLKKMPRTKTDLAEQAERLQAAVSWKTHPHYHKSNARAAKMMRMGEESVLVPESSKSKKRKRKNNRNAENESKTNDETDTSGKPSTFSNFDKELTTTDFRYVKKIRSNPAKDKKEYLEKKDFVKRHKKKETMQKNLRKKYC